MISHSSASTAIAKRLHERLSVNHAPRVDAFDLHPGDLWRRKLATWLNVCDVAIVLVCPAALTSDWVRHELSVLLNRATSDADGLQLLIQGLDVERAAIREMPGAPTSDVPRIQLCDPTGPSCGRDIGHDALFEELVAQVDAAPEVSRSPATLMAQQIRNDLTTDDVPIDNITKARRQFPKAIVDPWKFQSIDDPTTDAEKVETRTAFGHELCATPLEQLFDPLNELVLPLTLDRGGLVDRSVQTGIDPLVVRWTADVLDEGERSVVVAVEHADLFALAPAAGSVMYAGRISACFFAEHAPIAGADEWARLLADELESARSEPDRQRRFPDAARLAVERGFPVFVVLTNPVGLTREHLDSVESRWPGVRFVVPAQVGDDPAATAEALGIRLVGAGGSAHQWSVCRQAEEKMMDERAKLRGDLAREAA